MAKKRLKICWECPYRKGYFCGKCHCVLVAKAEVEEEECPELQWPEDLTRHTFENTKSYEEWLKSKRPT